MHASMATPAIVLICPSDDYLDVLYSKKLIRLGSTQIDFSCFPALFFLFGKRKNPFPANNYGFFAMEE